MTSEAQGSVEDEGMRLGLLTRREASTQLSNSGVTPNPRSLRTPLKEKAWVNTKSCVRIS